MNIEDINYWNSFWNSFRTNVPWETNEIDENLVSFIKEKTFSRSLEIGCGSGINSFYLSNYSDEVTSIDLSEFAITLAKTNYRNHNLEFKIEDLLEFKVDKQFDFIFDRGCFHGLRFDSQRKNFVDKISNLITDNGYWLSIIGSAENINGNQGPPRWSLSDIVSTIESYLKIIEIKECTLKNKNGILSPAWAVVSRKRIFPLDKSF